MGLELAADLPRRNPAWSSSNRPSSDSATPDTGTPPTPGVIDVHSASAGKALDGTLYKDW